jgi:hypothetical protein
MARKIHIPTREARLAVQKLLDALDKADTSKLESRTQLGMKRVGKTQNVSQWKQALRTTVNEIEEWCPSFTIDCDPRPRERRTNRSRS